MNTRSNAMEKPAANEWPLWEVFVRSKSGLDHKHCGSLHAADAAMEQPLCWITNQFDRSPGELLWVPAGRWGALARS